MTKNITDLSNKNVCLDSSESKSYSLTDKGGCITFKGWNIDKPEILIFDELKEYYEEYDILNFKIVSKLEQAYSCCRYFEGSDAQDEGYSYWLQYHDNYKKGYGKCTTFTITYELKDINKNN